MPELGGIICIIGGESYYHCFMRVAGAPIGETNCPNCKGKHAETEIAKPSEAPLEPTSSWSQSASIAPDSAPAADDCVVDEDKDLLDRLGRIYVAPDAVFPAPKTDGGYVIRYRIDKIGGVGPWVAG